jgi:hypothetical protein
MSPPFGSDPSAESGRQQSVIVWIWVISRSVSCTWSLLTLQRPCPYAIVTAQMPLATGTGHTESILTHLQHTIQHSVDRMSIGGGVGVGRGGSKITIVALGAMNSP